MQMPISQNQCPDPFQIMADNNLTGIYNVEIAQYSWIKEGIQEAAEAVFSLEERQNRYLDSRQYPFFGRKGKWHRAGQGPPAIYGFFFGGRFDLFQTPKYRDFARRVVPYTYTYRTDEQGVIGVAWSLLADNDKIWYLPNHGYKMGVYHQGFLDQSQVIKKKERRRRAKVHPEYVALVVQFYIHPEFAALILEGIP